MVEMLTSLPNGANVQRCSMGSHYLGPALKASDDGVWATGLARLCAGAWRYKNRCGNISPGRCILSSMAIVMVCADEAFPFGSRMQWVLDHRAVLSHCSHGALLLQRLSRRMCGRGI
jgi:hypothetical protein